MLKKLKTLPIIILLLIGAIYTLLNPSSIFKDILEALNVFINNLFPAMFFFYTLSDLLINYGVVSILEYLSYIRSKFFCSYYEYVIRIS